MHYHLEIYLPKETDIKNWNEVENLVKEYMKPYDEEDDKLFEDVQLEDLPTVLRPSEKRFIIGKESNGNDMFSNADPLIDNFDNMIESCNPVAFWDYWEIGRRWDKYHGDNVIEISEFRKLKLDLTPRILLINPHKPFYSEEMFLHGKWDCDVLAKLDELGIKDGYLVTVDCRF